MECFFIRSKKKVKAKWYSVLSHTYTRAKHQPPATIWNILELRKERLVYRFNISPGRINILPVKSGIHPLYVLPPTLSPRYRTLRFCTWHTCRMRSFKRTHRHQPRPLFFSRRRTDRNRQLSLIRYRLDPTSCVSPSAPLPLFFLCPDFLTTLVDPPAPFRSPDSKRTLKIFAIIHKIFTVREELFTRGLFSNLLPF